ncbi:hypothetical protein SGCOL_002182 [Colletotrichum sp. CLE4]
MTKQLPTTDDEDAEASAIIPGCHPIEATHFWWYWDFAGAVFAVICMILIAVTLSKANGSPLVAWPLLVSPNTIVAVLTTVARTALLVPLGSSISQLKWRHLLLKVRPLEHLQLFDNASWGPWASILMIRHLLVQSKLACALSLATILMLGISPSAQQILEYPTLYQELQHLDVAIGRADNALVSSMLNTTFLPFKNQDGWIGQFIVLRHPGKKWEDKGEWFSPSNPTTPEVLDTDFRRCRKTYRGVNATNGVIEIRDENVAESFLQFHERIDTDKDNPYDVDVFETLDGGDRYEFTRTLAYELPTTANSPMQMQHLLYRADMANLTRNFEVVLMDQARSSDPGDDRNATTFMQGKQFGSMTLIRVRWAWFAFPVAAVVLGLGLFLTTVVLTRQTPLLKDSLLALLFYPLRDWEQDEIYVEGAQASEKPQKLAGSLHGRLETDEGRYRIVKHENVAKDEPKGDFSCGEQRGA